MVWLEALKPFTLSSIGSVPPAKKNANCITKVNCHWPLQLNQALSSRGPACAGGMGNTSLLFSSSPSPTLNMKPTVSLVPYQLNDAHIIQTNEEQIVQRRGWTEQCQSALEQPTMLPGHTLLFLSLIHI